MSDYQKQIFKQLYEALSSVLDEPGEQWLSSCLEEKLTETIGRRMAAAKRKVGQHPFQMDFPWPEWTSGIVPTPMPSGSPPTIESPDRERVDPSLESGATRNSLSRGEVCNLFGADGWSTNGWDVSDAVRILLLLKCIVQSSKPGRDLIKEVYRQGDERERCAILKGAFLLDPGGELGDLFVDAGRTNSLDVFSSISMGNPYPALFYSEGQFNQLVLKALFMELDVRHILGLNFRIGPTLIQMCQDFRQERMAAGRSVPESIEAILS
ncbi:MAG: hypothetical protein CMN77_19845 [Spirochaetaceae bacterium]|nr:hypothetical protein [Spirochaetaceae bacterium]|tara:strand:- start:7897 stop:8697 length:801 start_codon:yes stop_codon:yes gene_type:complete